MTAFLSERKAGTLSLPYKHLRFAALLLLASPVLIFFLTWLKLWVGIPAAAIVTAALVWSWKHDTDDRRLEIPYFYLALIVLVLGIWVYFSGVGGFFTQKKDHEMRNAIFHDLIDHTWPVQYTGGRSLSYYIGIWLFPSLIGKLGAAIGGAEAGWLAARVALYCYVLLMLVVTVLLVYVKLTISTGRQLALLLGVLLFFSGMDILGVGAVNLPGGTGYSNMGHIEWYARHYQYSSNSTQLCWVYNQSVPAWLATGLFLNEKNPYSYAMIGLLTLPCSPLPLVGLAVLMVAMGVKYGVEAIRQNALKPFLRKVFGFENVTALTVVLGVFALYYMHNSHTVSGTNSGFRMSLKPFYQPERTRLYLTFVVVEFLILCLLLLRKNKHTLYITAFVQLIVFPFFVMGTAADFVMRASIPALFVLMVTVLEYLFPLLKKGEGDRFSLRAVCVCACLIIGIATPAAEYISGIRHYINSDGRSKYAYDNHSLEGLTDNATINFMAHDAENSLFYRLIARD